MRNDDISTIPRLLELDVRFYLDGGEIVLLLGILASQHIWGAWGNCISKTGTAHMYYSFTRSENELTINLFSKKNV